MPLGASCSHSIPVAHREGRGRLRAWLPEGSTIRRHVEVRSVQTAETEEVSLLLRPATGPCMMLVWLVAKRRPLVASSCCFRFLHEHYTTWWKICQAFSSRKTKIFSEGRLGAARGGGPYTGGRGRVIITRTSRIRARPGAAENFEKMCGEGKSRCTDCVYTVLTVNPLQLLTPLTTPCRAHAGI